MPATHHIMSEKTHTSTSYNLGSKSDVLLTTLTVAALKSCNSQGNVLSYQEDDTLALLQQLLNQLSFIIQQAQNIYPENTSDTHAETAKSEATEDYCLSAPVQSTNPFPLFNSYVSTT